MLRQWISSPQLRFLYINYFGGWAGGNHPVEK